MLSFLNIMDYLNFYCAPCLLGKKPASLFSMPIEIYNRSQKKIEELKELGLCVEFLYEVNRKAHLLVFSEEQTIKLLRKENIKNAYNFFGYGLDISFELLKEKLFKKFRHFYSKNLQRQNADIFPHEIGLFLGYPPEDVLQYYIKKGKDYLFSGYWKVYTNPEKAIEIFRLYDECRVYCMKEEFLKYHLLSA